MSKFKFDEDKTLKEVYDYVAKTYDSHYSMNKFQSTEFIFDNGHGEGFCLGNIVKYCQRYGKKNGRNRDDLLKIVHYAIMALYIDSLETEVYNNEDK